MFNQIAINLIKLYQIIAPTKIRSACRYEPSCSNYSLNKFKTKSFFEALSLTVKRLNRCKPPYGGIDE